jgi:UDP-glucose:(heptosyl)LPS alpha-1,3-glucosyltransferase
MTDIVFTKYHLKKFGGLEKYSLKILDFYLKKNYSITLLTTAISGDLKNKKNLQIIYIKIPKILFFFKLKIFDLKCKKWIKNNNPKAVFSFDRSSCYTHTRLGNGLHTSYLRQKKLFENFFQLFLNFINPKNRLILNLEKKGFLQPDIQKIIVNSKMVKEELLSAYSISSDKIEIVHNGVEFTETKNYFDNWEDEKKDVIDKLNLKSSDFQFIFIGNGYCRKGLITLLKALFKIREKSFHLSIIGKEKRIKKFKNLTKKLQLENKVTFFDKRDDIAKFYQLADALVIPSYYDPFSNVAIEALAMGVFVITSKFNGAKEIITEKNGMIIDIMDITSFSKSLETAMKIKKDQARAAIIRESVKHLDFPIQLNKLTKAINL